MRCTQSPPVWLREAEQRLVLAGVPSPEREAAALATYALGDAFLADPELTPTAAQLASFEALLAQRCARVPLSRLTGRVQFRGLELLVGPGVFLPQPETSSVVDWAVAAVGRLGSRATQPLCVDLCCGAGTIAMSLAAALPNAVVHAVELDAGALTWAQRNAKHHGLDVRLHLADAEAALPQLNGQFDLVASNPPYVATRELDGVHPEVRDHDPAVALEAGEDGLDLIRTVERAARRLLRSGGVVVVEHSDRQGTSALDVFSDEEVWTHVAGHRDHDELDRFVTASRR